MEMHTFDYTHILNNLRFHICNKGFEDISTEAFLQVSDIDHDVLPRAIVEDKIEPAELHNFTKVLFQRNSKNSDTTAA